MKFEYNGNLLEEDRINLVAKEIIDKYPQIDIEKAKDAAMLEGRISTNKTTTDELNRLYNIMLVNSDSKKIVSIIYKDFLPLLKDKENPDIQNYIYLALRINNYLENYDEFPLFNEFYTENSN